jgi:hypothetical protein
VVIVWYVPPMVAVRVSHSGMQSWFIPSWLVRKRANMNHAHDTMNNQFAHHDMPDFCLLRLPRCINWTMFPLGIHVTPQNQTIGSPCGIAIVPYVTNSVRMEEIDLFGCRNWYHTTNEGTNQDGGDEPTRHNETSIDDMGDSVQYTFGTS